MTTEQLHSLLERLEAAEGPNLNIERDIALAVDGATEAGALSVQWGDTVTIAPNYTASIDVTVSLIERLLPKWHWSVCKSGPKIYEAYILHPTWLTEIRAPVRERCRRATFALLIVLVRTLIQHKALIAEEQK